MPNRIIREAILSSEKMALLNWPEEVFYRRLQSIVDDFGRYEANPQLLRARCYPLQTDAVRVTDISRWMAACQTAGLILNYAVQGKQYLEVLNFGQQQRSTSKYPGPESADSTCNHLLSDAHLGVSVSGVVSGVDKPAAPSGAELFEKQFWPAYPKKRAKDEALKAFLKRKPDQALVDLMLKAIAWQKQTEGWQKEAGKYIPYPATWLNDACWLDEEKASVGGVSSIWHESAPGVRAKAAELGLDPHDEVMEPFPMFKARVMAAEALQGARA